MLPFLDRQEEQARLASALDVGGFVCVYGRRRLGKSRLVQRALERRPAVYYVGDQRDAAVQRAELTREIAAVLPGFDAVTYPSWEALLERWWRDSPEGAVLALDELPALVMSSPELPGILQKLLDRFEARPRGLVLCGSSQRMMFGLVLDASAPLYGRAREILRLEPLGAGWLERALRARDPASAVGHWATWGGVPRYWELARDFPSRDEAVRQLVLEPLGVLHREPDRILLDDVQEVARAASVLALIAAGAARLSEIGGRLGVPATSLSRPLARLVDLGLVERRTPFGTPPRDSKRSFYVVRDPFFRFWFRFVDPNRSALEARQVDRVAKAIAAAWPGFLAAAWEDLVRSALPRLEIDGQRWASPASWWGAGLDGKPLELDLVAESAEQRGRFLVGEVKLSTDERDVARIRTELAAKAARCPALAGGEIATTAVFSLRHQGARHRGVPVGAERVLAALR